MTLPAASTHADPHAEHFPPAVATPAARAVDLSSIFLDDAKNGDGILLGLPHARPRRRSWIPLAVIGLLLAGGLAWGVWLWLRPAEAAREITAAVTRGPLQVFVTERGELESANTVDSRCELEGRQCKIVEILPEGTQVTKGQVVVRFDLEQLNTTQADQLIKTKQAEGKARASKEELEVAKNKAESDIAQAKLKLTLAVLDRDKYIQGDYQVEVDDRQGAIALAQKDLQESEEKLAHYRNYVKKGFGTPEQLRVKESEVDRNRYLLSRDKAKLLVLLNFTRRRTEAELVAKAEDAERDLERTRRSGAATIEKAKSELEAAEVTANLERKRLELINKQLEKGVVTAPCDGILVYSKDRYWDQAARVQVGAMIHFQQLLFRIPDLSKMQVKVHVHESMVKKVKPKLLAEVRIEAISGRTLHGVVETVATLAVSNGPWDERFVKAYETVIRLTDLSADAGLRPGMSAEVKILVHEVPSTLLVPLQAVTEQAGKHFAFVHGPTGVEKRAVTIGENNTQFLEITDGLTEGEAVLLNARQRLLGLKGPAKGTAPATTQPAKEAPAAAKSGSP